MLPFDNKPWAKQVAAAVIVFTVAGLICLGLYLAHIHQLRIPESVGIFLLFLTIVPPNLAVLNRKPKAKTDASSYDSHRNGRGVTAH